MYYDSRIVQSVLYGVLNNAERAYARFHHFIYTITHTHIYIYNNEINIDGYT